jgi:hypothetical protein
MFLNNNRVSVGMSNELPVEAVVRVNKVEKIEAYNVATKPSQMATTKVTRSMATAKVTRSLTVNVVRVGDVDEKPDSFVLVPIVRN